MQWRDVYSFLAITFVEWVPSFLLHTRFLFVSIFHIIIFFIINVDMIIVPTEKNIKGTYLFFPFPMS